MTVLQTILDAISLYEFSVCFILFVISITTFNIYFPIVLFALLTKQIPEKTFKLLAPKSINQRPTTAVDCGVLNKGGDASGWGGFPSGHCAGAALVATYCIHLFTTAKTNKQKQKLSRLMILTVLFAVWMVLVRILNHCHTFTQAIAGMILGVVWGLGFVLFEKHVLMKWPLFVQYRAEIFPTHEDDEGINFSVRQRPKYQPINQPTQSTQSYRK